MVASPAVVYQMRVGAATWNLWDMKWESNLETITKLDSFNVSDKNVGKYF